MSTTSSISTLIAVFVAGCAFSDSGHAPRPMLLKEGDDSVFRVVRVTSGDRHTVSQALSGTSEAEGLVELGGHAVSIELGSEDGENTTMVYAVRPLNEHPASPDSLRAARTVRASGRGVDTDEQTVQRVLDPRLVDTAGEPGAGDVVELLLSFDEIPQEPMERIVVRERGRVRLADDAEHVLRVRLVAERLSELRAIQAPLLSAVESAFGVEVIETFAISNTALVRVPFAQLRSLALWRGVRRVEKNDEVQQLFVDGWEAARAAQIDQYINAGTVGSRANPSRHGHGRIALGLLDYSFEDDFESIGDARVRERWNCATAPCTSLADINAAMLPPWPLGGSVLWDTRHGTACAQIASGRTPTGGAYQSARGGSSRGAALFLMTHGPNAASILRVYERMASSIVDILSSSTGTSGFADCTGTGPVSVALNNLSRIYGTFVVQAAGNHNHSDPVACTVSDPAGATYAFPVGAVLDSATVGLPAANYATVQSGGIYLHSSRGNVPYLLGKRSIIATTAVGAQTLLPNALPNLYANIGDGTSFAAPLVAGAAVDLRDWWLLNGPTYLGYGYGTGFMNDPGFTYVQLLLMGDRQLENGGRADEGFDSLFGNGRFRARMFNTAGMDDPWGAQVSAFYITHNQTTTFNVLGAQALPAQADRLVVSMWWPESNYPSGADITMQVRTTCGAGAAFSRADLSFDNKKRVFIDATDIAVGSRCWAIDLTAHSVPASSWQGGLNRRYVYLSYYYEDEARDDLSPGVQ